MRGKKDDVEMLKTPALVCVLRTPSVEKALKAIESGADAVELRVDLFKHEDRNVAKVNAFVGELKRRVNAGVIITNRAANEGGHFEGSEDERLNLLAELIEGVKIESVKIDGVSVDGVSIDGVSAVDAVDVEFNAPRRSEIVKIARTNGVSVILSFHDFNGMPPENEIANLVREMHEAGADIAKIAVTPKTLEDALTLLKITLANASRLGGAREVREARETRETRGTRETRETSETRETEEERAEEGKAEESESAKRKEVAIIGMGAVGKHLRVIAPLYGSALTYGFLDEEAEVAPGQLSISEMRRMLNALSFSSFNTFNAFNPSKSPTNSTKSPNSFKFSLR